MLAAMLCYSVVKKNNNKKTHNTTSRGLCTHWARNVNNYHLRFRILRTMRAFARLAGRGDAPTSKEMLLLTQWRHSVWYTVRNYKHGLYDIYLNTKKQLSEEVWQNIKTRGELNHPTEAATEFPWWKPVANNSKSPVTKWPLDKLVHAKETTIARSMTGRRRDSG